MVGGAEEGDGADHHPADEAEGPARAQQGVDVRHEDGAQSSRSAPRGGQPAHVDALKGEQGNGSEPESNLVVYY